MKIFHIYSLRAIDFPIGLFDFLFFFFKTDLSQEAQRPETLDY